MDGCTSVITSDHLLTSDPDTSPHNLLYDVIIQPEVGRLSRRDRQPEDPVFTFSQADVNEGRVEFVHYAGNGSGSFVFQVVLLALSIR